MKRLSPFLRRHCFDAITTTHSCSPTLLACHRLLFAWTFFLFLSLSHFLSSVYNRVYKYLFVVWVFLFHSICSSTTLPGRACTCTFNILLSYAFPPLHTIRCPFFLYPPPFPHSLIRAHFVAHRYIVIVTPTFFAL